MGIAWNYWGTLEARTFAYSTNNLNRGSSLSHPSGYNDGVGLEQRWYVGGTYSGLGQEGYDVARATFLSVGYYPTKDMVDADGNVYKPGPFVRAYLTWPLMHERWYLFVDSQMIATRSFLIKTIYADIGTAFRPFFEAPHVEFRVGSENTYDPQAHEVETGCYVAIRLIY